MCVFNYYTTYVTSGRKIKIHHNHLNVVLDTLGNESPKVHGNIHLPFLVKFVQLWYIISKLTNKEDDNFNIKSTTKVCSVMSLNRYNRSVAHLTYNFSTARVEVLQGCPFHMLQFTKREVVSSCGHSKKPSSKLRVSESKL